MPDLALGSPQPDLTLTATHVGNFTPGDVGDTYTITVSNSGSGATTAAVSLVDTLPSGVTVTAMSGTGWTVNLATLTATCSDALAAGASYPALTITVNVAANAPASLTNTATVSGGGELITSNNTVSDPTTLPANTVNVAYHQNTVGQRRHGHRHVGRFQYPEPHPRPGCACRQRQQHAKHHGHAHGEWDGNLHGHGDRHAGGHGLDELQHHGQWGRRARPREPAG